MILFYCTTIVSTDFYRLDAQINRKGCIPMSERGRFALGRFAVLSKADMHEKQLYTACNFIKAMYTQKIC